MQSLWQATNKVVTLTFPDFCDDNKEVTIPAQPFAALFTGIGLTIAEIDGYQGKLTTQEFLNRVDWWFKNPSDSMPTLLLNEEILLGQYRNMLNIAVSRAQEKLKEARGEGESE